MAQGRKDIEEALKTAIRKNEAWRALAVHCGCPQGSGGLQEVLLGAIQAQESETGITLMRPLLVDVL